MQSTETQPAPFNDYALMAGIAEGMESAFSEFYDRYASLVMGVSMRILRDRSTAEDVVSDVFWEIWNRSQRYGPHRASPRTYLLTLTRSRAIDRLRANQKRLKLVQSLAIPQPNDTQSNQKQSDDQPLTQTVYKEQRQYVLKAVEGLPEDRQKAVKLSYFEGLSHGKIAKKLGQPLGTVKTHIRQGIIHLREVLRTYYGSEGSL